MPGEQLEDLVGAEMRRKAGDDAGSSTTQPELGSGSATTDNAAQAAAQTIDTTGTTTSAADNAAADTGAADTAATNNQNNAAQVDTDKVFSEFSEGYFKTANDFKSALPKLKGYDELETKYKKLQEELQGVFADPYEQKRNELKKSGASKEQLKAFEQINELGDLASLKPLDAKIMKLVLIDGYKQSVAERIVKKEFDVDNEDLDEDDREVLEDQLKVSAKDDMAALEKYKVQVSSFSNDDRKIQSAAEIEQLKTALTPVLNDFKTNFKSLGELDLKAKDNTDVLKYSIPVDDADRQELAVNIGKYFLENKLPLTQENWNEAMAAGRAVLMEKNFPKYIQNVYTTLYAKLEKEISDRYENTGGVQKGDKRGSETNETMFRSFQEKVASGNF